MGFNVHAQQIKEKLKKAKKGDLEAQLSLAYDYSFGGPVLSWYKKGKEKGDFIAGLEAMRLAELIAWKKSQEQKKENAAPVRETKRADVKSVAADVAGGQAKETEKQAKVGQAAVSEEPSVSQGKQSESRVGIAGSRAEYKTNASRAEERRERMYAFSETSVDDISREEFERDKADAAQGIAEAQYNLGLFYEHGKFVTQNAEESFRWYKKAAEQGNAAAQLKTGGYYGKGVGVAKDEAAAHRWFLKAAEQGNVAAQMNAGIDFARGTGTKKNIPEAIKWYKRAAENGNAEAEYLLAVIYMSGDGIAPDYPEAVRRFKNALRSEDKEIKKSAKEALSLLAKEGFR